MRFYRKVNFPMKIHPSIIIRIFMGNPGSKFPIIVIMSTCGEMKTEIKIPFQNFNQNKGQLISRFSRKANSIITKKDNLTFKIILKITASLIVIKIINTLCSINKIIIKKKSLIKIQFQKQSQLK